jgi:ribonuclease Z
MSHSHLWDVWNQSKSIKDTPFTLCGFSIASLRTSFIVKELNVMFDAAVSSPFLPHIIFLTHLHTDHMANLPFSFYNSDHVIIVYVPCGTEKMIEDFIKSAHPYYNHRSKDPILNYRIIGLIPSTKIKITIKKKDYLLEIFECYHGEIPCIGYGLSEIKKKLADEYIGLDKSELVKLKKSGIDITKKTLKHFFLYLGDTSAEILANPEIAKYSTIMIECTFIDDDEIERAIETHHIHWIQLKDYILSHPEITFILYHFSLRYKKEYIKEFFDDLAIANVIPWISN